MNDLRTLLEKATPGPWWAEFGTVYGPVPEYANGAAVAITKRHTEADGNGPLIAATRNALPFLLDVVDAARLLADGAEDYRPCLYCEGPGEGEHDDVCVVTEAQEKFAALDAHLRGES